MRNYTNYFKVLLLATLGVALLLGNPAEASAITYQPSAPWSGVVNTQGSFSSVGTQIVVPRAYTTCGTSSNVAIWNGLGGYGRFPFAQNGITVTPGGVGVWYELFDGSGATVVKTVYLKTPAGTIVAPKAGDTIGLSLTFSPAHSHLTFVWKDVTANTSATAVILGAAQFYNGATAEWIVEHGGSTGNIAQFTPINFHKATAVRSGVRVNATHGAGVLGLILINGSHTLDHVTASTSDESFFTTTWRLCN